MWLVSAVDSIDAESKPHYLKSGFKLRLPGKDTFNENVTCFNRNADPENLEKGLYSSLVFKTVDNTEMPVSLKDVCNVADIGKLYFADVSKIIDLDQGRNGENRKSVTFDAVAYWITPDGIEVPGQKYYHIEVHPDENTTAKRTPISYPPEPETPPTV